MLGFLLLAVVSPEAREDITGPIGRWVVIISGLLLIGAGVWKLFRFMGRLADMVEQSKVEVKEEVRAKTATIQPGSNGGTGLGDAIRGIDMLHTTLNRHMRDTESQRQDWAKWRKDQSDWRERVQEFMDKQTADVQGQGGEPA